MSSWQALNHSGDFHYTALCTPISSNAAGPRVWNYLPTNLGQPDLSYSRFRQSLKTFGPKRPFNCTLEILLLTYLLPPGWATQVAYLAVSTLFVAFCRIDYCNSLPPAVLSCDPLSTFRSNLKTHLYSTAFLWLKSSTTSCALLNVMWIRNAIKK